MDANEQKARELLAAEYAKAYAEPFGAPIDSHAIAVRVIAKALAQQAPADGDGYRLAWEHLAANSYDHHTPYMVCIPTDEWKAAEAMLAATPQAPQPVVDDNGLIVHGDWYTVEHTGTHIFDLDDDRERLLSILLHSNGDVGFAARVEGVGSWQGKATDPVFREALAEKETRLLQEAEKVLRQIADHKRKTKEQRLASSCVRFLDALRAELRSNDQVQP